MGKSLKIIEPWHGDGLRFTCTQCGNCCTGGPGYVWLTKEEIVRVAEHLSMKPEAVVEQYCRKIDGKFSFKERRRRGSYDCIFLEEREATHTPDGADKPVKYTQRFCAIYAVRPLQCRTWPFWHSNLASAESWEIAAQRCPGMNQGRKFGEKQIERIRDAADWPKDPPSSG